MKIELDLSKTLDENATSYFEKSKLERKKIKGLKIALSKQDEIKKKKEDQKIRKEKAKERKQKWFEKYRWFITSNNLLVVGGKSATQNEEIVKKYMKKDDSYFHADLHGAPHCIVKVSEHKKLKSVPEESKIEVAQFAVSFSSAFEKGISIADAYSVTPEQVSKSAPSGMSMGTGAFMIYGEREYFKKTKVEVAIGYYPKESTLMCGPTTAIKKWCNNVILLKQGTIEKNKASKIIKDKFKDKGLDFKIDLINSLLPNGTFEIS
jgi:predicted ribosome quality control (RQC) complex YloA/Tae2 family protein